MNEHEKNLTYYTACFINGLVQAGVECAVISPGSRSTPMALLMAEHPDLKTYIQIDERSAAFFALGLAKASGKAVAMLCTSGTAAANYFPAIAEAKNARVPLIVLTSDRPHELREVGAPQTIDQNHLYGSSVKWFAEMALPDASPDMLRYVEIAAARSVYTAMQAPAGPVHLNFPFREPLIPVYDGIFENLERKPINQIKLLHGKKQLSKTEVAQIAAHLSGKDKGIIVCGELNSQDFANEVVALAKKLGYPILADPLSQLRVSSEETGLVLDSYDAFLRNKLLKKGAAFDVVLRFGAMPVSKALTLYLKEHKNKEHYIIDGSGGWRDPIGAVSYMIASEEADFCRMVGEHLPELGKTSQWLSKWQQINAEARGIMEKVRTLAEMDEGRLFYEMIRQMPDDSSLLVGNSMPIRDLDSFFFTGGKNIKLYANRGANGIDGLVSTALGVAAHGEPMYLVVGDLSFFHDLNGLLAVKLNSLKMTVVVFNNNGGGIFSYLPQAASPKHFELLFGTPADLDFSHAASLYGGSYKRAESLSAFKEAIADAEQSEGLFIIEAITDREENVVAHRGLWEEVSQEIDRLPAGDEFWR